MTTIEKYGENLFEEFNNNLEDIKNNFKNVYGEKIKLINFKHSRNIKMSTNKMGNYNIESNRWHVYNEFEIVGNIHSMFDIFGDYYFIEITD